MRVFLGRIGTQRKMHLQERGKTAIEKMGMMTLLPTTKQRLNHHARRTATPEK